MAKNLIGLESLQLGAFLRRMLDPGLVQGVAYGVFTAFAKDLGDLQYRSPFLQIQTLDLLDLRACEARFLAHLLLAFDLSLSGGA